MHISQLLLIIANVSTGVIYGTDMFHAIVVKKAASLSKDSSIADLIGHTHLLADKRMPGFGITALLCTTICIVLNFSNLYATCLSGAALLMLLSHLYLYMTIAKPVNKVMADGVVNNIVPVNIRALQNRWDSVIGYRAALLTFAMLLLSLATIVGD
ncbi:hypothetical protein [Chitinophaga sancti]|uniref:DUF1772 domain-containing protein n=1 Tax=Chitinophaga sancti TaxID=1004 RepID=A0A1K1M6Z1_9BACT|nr:hypothetical protein [Chitinophaga sancti]WQD64592.1 hypothetical protein U0033_09310 [Chitinophaga sancti]WQG89784.1 hypothetical protein SR876_33165 [Chitinophaga sancti]SFW18841.1 hypothetical protein SAMN05661012_00491 [Chitinophaga sancti]